MNKKLLGLIFSMFLITSIGIAQKDKIQEKVKARRVGFITEKLQLTSEEAQLFWPVFNEFQLKRKAIRKTYGGKVNFNLMTDEEVLTHVKRQIEKEEKMLILKKKYIGELKNVLPIRKVALLPGAEKQFKEWMLRQVKKKNSIAGK